MANITVSVRSLWGTSIYRAITIDNAQTFEALIAAVAAEDNLQSDYYHIYLCRDMTINDITFGDSSTTLASKGIVTGDVFVTKSRVSEVAAFNKGEAQRMKLEIAQAKRQADGDTTAPYYRENNYYDIALLPTQYSGSNIVDNVNAGGLVDGRPWQTTQPYLAGAYRRTYGAYYNGTVTYFNSAPVTGTAVTTNFEVSTATTNFSYQYLGYILSDYTGTWTFAANTDDYAHIWVGANALLTPGTAGAASFSSAIGSGSFTVSMTAGTYYPIRVMYGNNTGPGALTLSWDRDSSGASTNWTDKLFYNPVTNGF